MNPPSRKGCIPWNKGLKATPEACKHQSDSHKGKLTWNKGKKMPEDWIHPMKGKKHGEKIKEKISRTKLSQSLRGKLNPNYKDGLPHCRICGEELSNYRNKVCRDCWYDINQGENHSNWKGGISFLPYCIKFNKELKELVRRRDNYICQLCNKTQEKNGAQLSVHHIHHDKENCYPDLIILCRSCNVKVEKNEMKKKYEEIFMNNLNGRNLLFWNRGN